MSSCKRCVAQEAIPFVRLGAEPSGGSLQEPKPASNKPSSQKVLEALLFPPVSKSDNPDFWFWAPHLCDPGFLHLYVAVFGIVGMDGAEALQGGHGERDAGGATDVLQLFHLTDALLEHAAEEERLTWLKPAAAQHAQEDVNNVQSV